MGLGPSFEGRALKSWGRGVAFTEGREKACRRAGRAKGGRENLPL